MDGKKRMNVEGDKISNLPDDLIHKILTFTDIKHAVQTSGLSSRWRYIWTTMPFLNFSTAEFPKLPAFSKFVNHVLSNRNNEIEVFCVRLAFRGKVSQVFVKKILKYAFSHNVQQLYITCLSGEDIEFPLFVFNSHSLKHLTLTGNTYRRNVMTSSVWDLPALVTLSLKFVVLYVDNTDERVGLFSNCANLKNLTLNNCKLKRVNGFSICLPELSSLTLEDGYKDVNIVTPQLKNLIINDWDGKLLISAPNLSILRYKTYYCPLEFSADFLNLEKVDICVRNPSKENEDAHKFVSLLQLVHSVKSLTFNSEIIKSLSSSVELIAHLPSPFTNLKTLKIYPLKVYLEPTQREITMSTEVKNYLLDSSPGATFTMVSREEIRTEMNVNLAENLMKELKVVLNLLKLNNIANLTHLEKENALAERLPTTYKQVIVENHNAQPDAKMKGYFGERVANIKCYWKDLNKELEVRQRNTLHTVSRLHKIEQVLTRLPTSDRDKLQARFCCLCVEADTVLDNIMDRMKTQCDKKPRR